MDDVYKLWISNPGLLICSLLVLLFILHDIPATQSSLPSTLPQDGNGKNSLFLIWGKLQIHSEKEMATHSSILTWRILWAEEPGGLLSLGLHRVSHNWSDLAYIHALEKEMAAHSSVLAWRIPGTKESMGSHRVGHDWSDLAAAADTLSCIALKGIVSCTNSLGC